MLYFILNTKFKKFIKILICSFSPYLRNDPYKLEFCLNWTFDKVQMLIYPV